LEYRFPEVETPFAETRFEWNYSAESRAEARGMRAEKAPQEGRPSLNESHARFQPRESSDNPMLNAFCRVAPSVRFRVFAMLAARVFFFASVFKVRTCSDVHARRFNFLDILLAPDQKGRLL
jgi:hypothetical protein